jgi:thiol:disulfide interchange protein DsbD
MRNRLLLLALWIAMAPAWGADHTGARLILSRDRVRPGDRLVAALELRMPPGMHTYWRNPGSSGLPTAIQWTLPDGITAGEILWPVPERIESAGMSAYGYHDSVMLLVPLTVASNAPHGHVRIAAKASWLECREACVPGKTNFTLALDIGDTSITSGDATEIENARAHLPGLDSSSAARAWWENSSATNSRMLSIAWPKTLAPPGAAFFPHVQIDDSDATPPDRFSTPGENGLRLKVTRPVDGSWPGAISGLLIWQTNDVHQAVEIAPAIRDRQTVAGPSADTGDAVDFPLLLKMLSLAFLGGLILNIMPCVFPVIALKIMGFVSQSQESSRRVLRLGLLYSAGVLVSFLLLAVMVLVVQRAGGQASWGMQMQNPYFSMVLTTLVVLVALNLFGVFEVTAGGRAMDAAGRAAAREGGLGAFLNGMLATVLATPCTAPFLATALGFAFTPQPPWVVITLFATIGLGLAAPYLVLSGHPAWLRFLPRPGPWMERFKNVMGFPMLATAVWLFSFTARRFGNEGPLWAGLFLVATALAAWIWGEFVQRGNRRRGLAAILSLGMLAGAYLYAMEFQLQWRTHRSQSSTASGIVVSGGIEWRKWSPAAFDLARREGRPILVDFSADWCLTCKFNKTTAIETPGVAARIKTLNAIAFIADNTDEDPAIIAELKRHDRAGVPLVLVYPADPGQSPAVLPAVLTKGLVLEALEKAANTGIIPK